jgi:branched-subunit amino acid transport protein
MKRYILTSFVSVLLALCCVIAIIAAYLSENMGLDIITGFFCYAAIITGVGSIITGSKPFKN